MTEVLITADAPEATAEPTQAETLYDAPQGADSTPPPEEAPPAATPDAEDELELPENLTASDLDEVKAFAKENGLTNAQAQKLLQDRGSVVQRFSEAQLKAHEDSVNKWHAAVSEDKELGGANFKGNMEVAKRFAQKYASPELLNMLRTTGYGNHPELVRLMYRAGKAMAEAEMISPSPDNAPRAESAADILYPTSKGR